MFYETAQTVGPGWHRAYKPSHYEDMSWSPSSRHFRSPGSSPETYRRIIRNEEDFPTRTKESNDDEFFSEGRRSPTFPRRIFKEVWNETPPPNHRFSERPRMFKRVFKPSHWEDEVPHIRRAEREFDRNFDDSRPSSRKFDEDFERRFNLQKDMEDEFDKSEGRVHHIPIMVERRMEELKSRFGRNSPPPERTQGDDEYTEEWSGPQVQRLRKTFEPTDEGFSTRHHRVPRADTNSKPRAFTNSIPETWDPHAVHTLPTRKAHKSSQSFDDSRHPVPPKYVYRSYSETHEDIPKPQQPHSAAFRSHSDGHCPNQTYVTKIEVNLPSSKKVNDELRSSINQSEPCDSRSKRQDHTVDEQRGESSTSDQTSGSSANESSGSYQSPETPDDRHTKPKYKSKYDSHSLQQIAAVLQNVEDLVIRVEGYNGAGRDKQYRFLDEMLTRCMLRLDDVDTEGREDIRSARKAAVREVQSCIDRLEAKADESERRLMAKSNPDTVPLGGVSNATPEVIPLGGVFSSVPEVIPLGGVFNATPEVIPLGGVFTATPEVIPLGGVSDSIPEVIPLSGVSKAIPLGDVPKHIKNKEQNGKDDKAMSGDQAENFHQENGEQTKL